MIRNPKYLLLTISDILECIELTNTDKAKWNYMIVNE